MTFEQRLRELVESLADRLRHEAAGHFQESMGDLHELLKAERSAAVSEAVGEARETAGREAADRLEAAVADAVREARETSEREAADRLDAVVAEAVRYARETAEREAADRLESAVEDAVRQAREIAEREAAERVEFAVADAARDAREAADRETVHRLEAAVADAERQAREAAERETAERLTVLVSEAETRAYDSGRTDGRREGEESGREAGKDAWKEAGKEEGRAEGKEAGKEEGRVEGKEEGRRVGAEDAIERLAAATRLVDESRSLSEILDALADAARREAGSAALFLVRGDELRSWRLSGFGHALDDAARFDIPMSDAGLLAVAVREGKAARADSADEASVPGFVSLPPGRQMLAVPVRLSADVVAVLYGDQGEHIDPRPAWPAALEILVRHASRSLEVVTAFRAAKLLSGSPSGDAIRSGAAEGGSAVTSVGNGDRDSSDPEDGVAARRYARLLISEIKLYHETDVLAGRRERDLATRLGGEIARARVLYEQRVSPDARSGADHFHAELVSTLANGDASLLGT